MRTKRNPIHRHGNRNALCPYYRACLNMAVKKAWEYWDCAECPHKTSIDPEFDIECSLRNPVTYYDLPMEIAGKM